MGARTVGAQRRAEVVADDKEDVGFGGGRRCRAQGHERHQHRHRPLCPPPRRRPERARLPPSLRCGCEQGDGGRGVWAARQELKRTLCTKE